MKLKSFPLLCCVLLTFFSCTNDFGSKTQINFSIPKQAICREAETSDYYDKDKTEDYSDYDDYDKIEENIVISVKLCNPNGSEIQTFEESKSSREWENYFYGNTSNSFDITFEEIAVGTKLYAVAAIYTEFNEKRQTAFTGKSDIYTIQKGTNNISITLKSPDIKITFLFQKEEGSNEYIEKSEYPTLIINNNNYDSDKLSEYFNNIFSSGYMLNSEKSIYSEAVDEDGYYTTVYYFDFGSLRLADGSITLPDFFATISLNKNEVYVSGDTVYFTTLTSNYEQINDVIYTAKLLYGGKDIGSDYYTVDGSKLIINELEIKAPHQLCVTASFKYQDEFPVTLSQTFNLSGIIPTTFYVREGGSDSNSGVLESFPLASLTKADELINYYATKMDTNELRATDWVINVTGTIFGPQKMTCNKGNSITIQGTNDSNNSNVIEAGGYIDHVVGSALTLTDCVPVTINNMTIEGGYTNNAGGGICASVTLTLNNCVIQNNYATEGGGISSSGTLYVCDTIINNNTATKHGGGISTSNDVYLYGGTVIGNKDATSQADSTFHGNTTTETPSNDIQSWKYGGGGIHLQALNSEKTLYLGYCGKNSDETLIESELTGGIYYNYSAAEGGAIVCGHTGTYDTDKTNIRMNSGTIAYNTSANKDNGIYLHGYSEASTSYPNLPSKNSIFYIGNDACINDIVLIRGGTAGTTCITVEKLLKKHSESNPVSIKPYLDTTSSLYGYTVLKVTEPLSIPEVKQCFTVVPNGSTPIYINNNGELSLTNE